MAPSERFRSLVLCDIDGTLIRGSGPHHKNALLKGIYEVTGIAANFDGIPTQGMLDCDLIRLLLDAAGQSSLPIEQLMPDLIDASQSAYLDECPDSLEHCVCPGVEVLLGQLREAEAMIAVVSGNLEQIGWRKLELAGIRHFFNDGAFSTCGLTRAHLATQAIERAIAAGKLGLGARISLIGDHPNDVRAAQLNGIQSVATATGFSTRQELLAAEAAIVVDDLSLVNLDVFF